MYYPYFRGKQFELITIRETATLISKSDFVPIIEPVKESLNSLEKTLVSISKADGKAIVIINPCHGDHKENNAGICQFISQSYSQNNSISAGILLRNDTTIAEALQLYNSHTRKHPTFVHAGFTNPKALAGHLKETMQSPQNAFVEDHARTLYRKHFEGSSRILIKDGFKRKRNADYPEVEEFSDLHITYRDLGMAGFGDFLIVGDNYAESGGPAYAVAIHLTFIDSDNDDVMGIYHFVSDTKDTPTDPAGKFGQALRKLVRKLDSGSSKLVETSAIEEFRSLHAKGHFPGLGYVKKLSMKHHIETLASYCAQIKC